MNIKLIKIMQYFFVYIIKCNDNSYYTGHTDNIEQRISEHFNKKSTYTASRFPIEVVFVQQFNSRYEALEAEFKIKGWSRKKKEALMCSDWNKISILSKKKFKK